MGGSIFVWVNGSRSCAQAMDRRGPEEFWFDNVGFGFDDVSAKVQHDDRATRSRSVRGNVSAKSFGTAILRSCGAWRIRLSGLPPQRFVYRKAKRSQIVFADDGASARVQYLCNPHRISAPGDAECRNVQAELADQGQRFGAAEGGQLVICDDDVPGVLIERAPHFGSVENSPDAGRKTTPLEMTNNQLTVILAVFDHENA